VAIEYRWAEGQFNRLEDMAADLVDRHVAVMFIGGADIRMRAVTAAVSPIPVVFTAPRDCSICVPPASSPLVVRKTTRSGPVKNSPCQRRPHTR
jgi:hypothetical protein